MRRAVQECKPTLVDVKRSRSIPLVLSTAARRQITMRGPGRSKCPALRTGWPPATYHTVCMRLTFFSTLVNQTLSHSAHQAQSAEAHHYMGPQETPLALLTPQNAMEPVAVRKGQASGKTKPYKHMHVPAPPKAHFQLTPTANRAHLRTERTWNQTPENSAEGTGQNTKEGTTAGRKERWRRQGAR